MKSKKMCSSLASVLTCNSSNDGENNNMSMSIGWTPGYINSHEWVRC